MKKFSPLKGIIIIGVFLSTALGVWLFISYTSQTSFKKVQTIASLAIPNKSSEFNTFISDFFDDQALFYKKNDALLSTYDETNELPKLQHFFIAFGTYHDQLLYLDWLGEESENEIEVFIKNIDTSIRTQFPNARNLRNSVEDEYQIDTAFIKKLFIATDKDLMTEKKQLLFVKNNWDGYILTVVKESDFKKLLTLCTWFYGSSDLKGINTSHVAEP
jgi:hypothetical protein